MKLRLLMRTELVSVLPHLPADQALLTMEEHGFHHFPVVDDASRLVGVLSDRDLLRRGEELACLRVLDLMVKQPLCLSPEDTVAQAAALMMSQRINCIPLLEEGVMVGLVTHIDLLSVLARE